MEAAAFRGGSLFLASRVRSAENGTRTRTAFRPPASQTGASTVSPSLHSTEGRIRTDTGHGLNVLPLPIGLPRRIPLVGIEPTSEASKASLRPALRGVRAARVELALVPVLGRLPLPLGYARKSPDGGIRTRRRRGLNSVRLPVTPHQDSGGRRSRTVHLAVPPLSRRVCLRDTSSSIAEEGGPDPQRLLATCASNAACSLSSSSSIAEGGVLETQPVRAHRYSKPRQHLAASPSVAESMGVGPYACAHRRGYSKPAAHRGRCSPSPLANAQRRQPVVEVREPELGHLCRQEDRRR
jgi:hypothetical protein